MKFKRFLVLVGLFVSMMATAQLAGPLKINENEAGSSILYAAGDVDQDGLADIVGVSVDNSNFSANLIVDVWKNLGDMNFELQQNLYKPLTYYIFQGLLEDFTLRDIDANGFPDLVISYSVSHWDSSGPVGRIIPPPLPPTFYQGVVEVILNEGNDQYADSAKLLSATSAIIGQTIVENFDQDAELEFLSCSYDFSFSFEEENYWSYRSYNGEIGKVAWYDNHVWNDSLLSTEHELTQERIAAKSMCLADLDLDGNEDIVFASTLNKEISWLRNLGNFTFDTMQVLSDTTEPNYRVVVADCNQDGLPDLVYSTQSIYQSYSSVGYLPANGDGTF